MTVIVVMAVGDGGYDDSRRQTNQCNEEKHHPREKRNGLVVARGEQGGEEGPDGLESGDGHEHFGLIFWSDRFGEI